MIQRGSSVVRFWLEMSLDQRSRGFAPSVALPAQEGTSCSPARPSDACVGVTFETESDLFARHEDVNTVEQLSKRLANTGH